MSRAPKQAREQPAEHPKPARPNTTVHHVKHITAPFTYIGRACDGHAASPWANPYRIASGKAGRDRALALFRNHAGASGLHHRIAELRGQRLACWCHPEPCHGDYLATLANALHFHGQPCPTCSKPVKSSPVICNDRVHVVEYWRCPSCLAYGFQERGAILNPPTNTLNLTP